MEARTKAIIPLVGVLFTGAILFMTVPTAAEAGPCTTIGAAQANLASGLIEELARDPENAGKNLIVAPIGLAAVFASLSRGADPTMKAAMIDALQFEPADSCDPKTVFGTVLLAQTALAKGVRGSVQMADRIVLGPSAMPDPLVLKSLAAEGREIARDDVGTSAGQGRVNDWVKKKTHGLIASILPAPLPDTPLLVLNALHFKAKWKTPFDGTLTKPQPFNSVDGHARDVMMMHLAKGAYSFRVGTDFIAVDLPFVVECLSLIVVTTQGPAAPASVFSAATPFLEGRDFEDRLGIVAIPRLKLSVEKNLLSALSALGLDKAASDPTKLNGFAPDLQIGKIVQRIEMTADEKGAEAAAVTVNGDLPGPPSAPKPINMIVDKPFVFALRDRETGLVLIAGYVSTPVP